MKEYMMVIGSRIIDNDWMEINLIPLTTVKKKTNLFDMTNLDQILEEVQGTKPREAKVSMKLEMWTKLGLKIGSHVTLELSAGEV